ncbi:PxxKW family cysteine-rich protein [Desulfosediminicola sp.]|uniref:PxxKW family cysteine-rich protein n=1 Tax=Desulfosediminicola sp. TaxID=2886825 RepID=UPI003AF2D7A4
MQKETAASYKERNFKPVVEKCDGCERMVEEEGTKFCQSYLNPDAKWRLGICNFATHAKPEITVTKVRVNPLKAAKRASKGK